MFFASPWEKCYSMRSGNAFDMSEFGSSFFLSFSATPRVQLMVSFTIGHFADSTIDTAASFTTLVSKCYHCPVIVTLMFSPFQMWRVRPKPKPTLCFWLMAPGVLGVSTLGPFVHSLPKWLESLTLALTGCKLVGETEFYPPTKKKVCFDEVFKDLFFFQLFLSTAATRRPTGTCPSIKPGSLFSMPYLSWPTKEETPWLVNWHSWLCWVFF